MIDAIIKRAVVTNSIEPEQNPVVIVYLEYNNGKQTVSAVEHLVARLATANYLESLWKNRKAKIKIVGDKITEIRT